VLAPFRLVRLVLFGFFTVSATVGLVIALSQLAGGLANAPNALPLQGTIEVGPNTAYKPFTVKSGSDL
jgi:hypothetical protein